ncbi:MAG TPA: SRPBCC domain-containing protein [Propionibacteriaceae bacterium]
MSTDRLLNALAEPNRRALLDALTQTDGLSISELGATLPHLGRHAVLKHITVLEDVDLVKTVKTGRVRRCHLNPVPLLELAGRWTDLYGRTWGGALLALRARATTPPEPSRPTKEPTMPDRVFSIVIAAPIERVWQALTSSEDTVHWYFGNTVESSWEPDTPITYRGPDGEPDIEGTVLLADPPHVLRTTFRPIWSAEVQGGEDTVVEWRLERDGALCRVTVTHTGLPAEGQVTSEVGQGWTLLLSGLKTLLETGQPLTA